MSRNPSRLRQRVHRHLNPRRNSLNQGSTTTANNAGLLMPTYEYECDKCSLRFEVKRSFTESGGNICPRCGSEGRQIYFPMPLHFKGSGFYITDIRKTSDSSVDGDQPTKPDLGKPTAKSDIGKPATKPDLGVRQTNEKT